MTSDTNDMSTPAPLTCAVCGKPASIMPFPTIHVSGHTTASEYVHTSHVLATGQEYGLMYSTLVDRPYCPEHDPTVPLSIRTERDRLRSDLACAQAATQSERDEYHSYRAEVARDLARLRSLLRAICDDAEVFGWKNDAIRQARTLLPADGVDTNSDDATESKKRAK